MNVDIRISFSPADLYVQIRIAMEPKRHFCNFSNFQSKFCPVKLKAVYQIFMYTKQTASI